MVEKTPEPAWARGRGTKRKAGAGGKKGGKGSKSRKTDKGGDGEGEDGKMPAMNPAKIMEAHPVCVGVGVCLCLVCVWCGCGDGVGVLTRRSMVWPVWLVCISPMGLTD